MDPKRIPYRSPQESRPALWIRLILFYQIPQGVWSIHAIAQLPASESGSALLGGLSWMRIMLLLACAAGMVLSAILLFWTFTRPEKWTDFWAGCQKFFHKHDFELACILCLCGLIFIAGIGLENFFNSGVFPQAAYYEYLYLRIRPLSLWVAILAGQVFLLAWFYLWKPNSERLVRDKQGERRGKIYLLCLLLAWLMMGVIWYLYIQQGALPADMKVLTRVVLLLSLLSMLAPVFLTRRAGMKKPATLEPDNESGKSSIRTTVLYLALAVLWSLLILYAGYAVGPLADNAAMQFDDPAQFYLRYGFNQLHLIPAWATILVLLAAIGLGFALEKGGLNIRSIPLRIGRNGWSNWTIQLAIVLLFGFLFWIFRSNFNNQDFIAFKSWFAEGLQSGTTVVKFDEMWETNLHFEFYKLSSRLLGWSVDRSFQFLSCLAGTFSIWILLKLCERISPAKPAPVFLMLISGGFMQLFFGDKECYSLAAALILLYIFLAFRYLKGEISLLLPSFGLILAMTFHMECVFLIPSLLFLFVNEFHERRYLSMINSVLLFAGFFSLTLLYFTGSGVSLARMVETSWGLGRGGSILANFVRFEPAYFWGQINLLGLLYPAVWLVLPLLLTRRYRLNRWNLFLALAALCGVVMFFAWQTSIGLYNDWNLYALPLLPLIIWLVYHLSRQQFPLKKSILVYTYALAGLFSYTWIISNHFI